MVKMLTTINSGHRHRWRKGNKFTSIDDGHKHRIKGRIALPIRKGGHTHRLLLKKRKIRSQTLGY